MGKDKKVTGMMKDALSGKIMGKFVGFCSKTYSPKTIATMTNVKKAKGTKKYVVKRKLKFEDYKNP